MRGNKGRCERKGNTKGGIGEMWGGGGEREGAKRGEGEGRPGGGTKEVGGG